MLIIALVLALVGLAALVAAVVTSNELIAWVCIGASVIGVLLLIADALRSRGAKAQDSEADAVEADAVGADAVGAEPEAVQDYPDDEPEPDAGSAQASEPDAASEPDPDPTDETDTTDASDTADDSAQSDTADDPDTTDDPNTTDDEIAGVTDTDEQSEAGGAVTISPDPDGPAKS